MSRKPATYSRFDCNRSARGASGATIVSQAFATSTSRMALRETFLRADFCPKVATSLDQRQHWDILACRERHQVLPHCSHSIFTGG